MSQEFETRSIAEPVSVVPPQDGKAGKLSGRPIVFESRSIPLRHPRLGAFRETVQRAAIEKAIQENPDLLYMYNHDDSSLIARSANGSLRLTVDDRGLLAEADLPDTQLGRDLAVMVQTGLITGQSFRMIVTEDNWQQQDGELHREVRSCKLIEMGPCIMPAYPDTNVSAEARSAIDSLLDAGAPASSETNDDEAAMSALRLAEAELTLLVAEEGD